METLDKCFENVCELDLIFHMDKVGCSFCVLLWASAVVHSSTWLPQSPTLPRACAPTGRSWPSLELWSLSGEAVGTLGVTFGERLKSRVGKLSARGLHKLLTLCPPDKRSELLGSVLSPPWVSSALGTCPIALLLQGCVLCCSTAMGGRGLGAVLVIVTDAG